MDGLSITKAANILKKRYEGNQLTKVSVTEDSVCLGIYSDDKAAVMIRVTGGKPSVHTVFSREGVTDKFLERLNGGRLTEVSCRRYDRIISFSIEKRRPSGKMETHKLVFELIGKMANAVLLNENGMIIWTFCKNNADPDRQTGTGVQYQMPRSNKSETLDKNSGRSFADLLGFYPVTVKHAEKYMAADYSFNETAVLIHESLEDGEDFYLDDAGRLIPFRPLEGGETVPFDRVGELSGVTQSVKRDVSVRNRLARYFEKQAEKYLKLKDQLTEELTQAEKHAETRRRADLIKANIYRIKDASGTVELDEYTEEGINKVAYDIPEGFDVNKEVAKLYRRADKLKRSVPLLEKRLEEVDNIIDSALEQLYFTEISADDDELRELALEMKRKEPKNKKQQTNQKQFEKLQIGDGTAYIGRNSVGNHRLVFQFANPSDWWFHAQKIPSAHLIFRKDGQITEAETQECASLVAGLSKAKNDLKVTVDYTQKKNVKKPKNTPPGFVIYHRFFSVTVEPDKRLVNGDK